MILYEDKEIIVCHKRAGMPVQSASVRQKDMVSVLRNHLGGGDVYVVHRLDQPVEGVVVFAKTKAAAADLSRQIANGNMRKVYQAVVELPVEARIAESGNRADVGKAGKTESAIENEKLSEIRGSGNLVDGQYQLFLNEWHPLVDYLVKDGRTNRSFVSEAGRPGAKRAELRYRILKWWDKEPPEAESFSRLALVEIELMTGRHHQIRVQMAHAGLPLAGDRKYNPRYAEDAKNGSVSGHGEVCLSSFRKGEKAEETVQAEETFRRATFQGNGGAEAEASASLALCAVSLTFRHPSTKKRVTYEVTPQFTGNLQAYYF